LIRTYPDAFGVNVNFTVVANVRFTYRKKIVRIKVALSTQILRKKHHDRELAKSDSFLASAHFM
jgi:hypothetical protein